MRESLVQLLVPRRIRAINVGKCAHDRETERMTKNYTKNSKRELKCVAFELSVIVMIIVWKEKKIMRMTEKGESVQRASN